MMTTESVTPPPVASVGRDLTAGLVVFLVALPLCLGVAIASDAPPFAGVLAGIIGGILVGLSSGSQTSVSGPSPGLTAVVAAQLLLLGSFPAFLLALFLAGLIQIGMGLARAGFIAAFFPSGVIKGLLAAIGVILILKQIPHVVGHDPDPEGDMAFFQIDKRNTFSELAELVNHVEPGAALIGLASIALLVAWDRWRVLKRLPFPAPLAVVLLGVGAAELFRRAGQPWLIDSGHLVQVPVAGSPKEFFGFLQSPDFGQWSNPAVYTAALMIAVVASLESLLNLEAVDKIDPRQRTSPPNRELVAQGVGNAVAGLLGGLPISSVIVRGSVNVNAGATTKRATIIHGVLLLVSVAVLPAWLNRIPLSCLAAILLVTGVKLASPALVRQMWQGGRNQFLPFVVTVAAIVLTDLLTGILIGLGISIAFILRSNMRRPLRRFAEKHLGGEVLRIELSNQVSFLNRAALSRVLDGIPAGGHVLLDAHNTDYIDPDILDLIRDFKEKTAPVRGVEVSMNGFRRRYQFVDEIQYLDYSSRELQESATPQQVLQILQDGHDRFRTGRRLTRDLGRQVTATAGSQHPLAVVLSCIDSRSPAELIFDVGVGDIFSVRVAGNTSGRKVLGSVEYACAVAGAKLILVLGHTRCGAVTAAVDRAAAPAAPEPAGCRHIGDLIQDIQRSIDPSAVPTVGRMSPDEKRSFVDDVARRNVARVVGELRRQSVALDQLAADGKILIVGAMYNVATGDIEFLGEPGDPPRSPVTLRPGGAADTHVSRM